MYIKVKVIPGAKEEKIEHIRDDEYRIWVQEEVKGNLANRRVLTLFKDVYPGKAVRLVSGHHSPAKIVSIV